MSNPHTVMIRGAGDLDDIRAVSVAIAGSGVAFIAMLYFARSVYGYKVARSTEKDYNGPLGKAEARKQEAQRVELERLSGLVHSGAKEYLFTQYKYLALWVCCLSIIIGAILRRSDNNLAGLFTMICYIVGSLLSGAAGFIGMYTATSANARTADACASEMLHEIAKQKDENLPAAQHEANVKAAQGRGILKGLQISFAAGSVMGNGVVCLGLSGLWVLFLIWMGVTEGSRDDPHQFDMVWGYLAGFGFGASSIGMFARVGGGVFTKAADVGADLVGKVENNIPEDDWRNPAVIADNVGDNVGDVAGMGADLFESYAGALIATATLSPELYALAASRGYSDMTLHEVMMAGSALPFWIYGFGIIISLIGTYYVRNHKLSADATLSDLLHQINVGIYIASILSIGTTITACVILFDSPLSWRLFGCVMIGLVAGIIIAVFTEYCTSYEDSPTRNISAAAEFGPAPVMIKGLGVGMMSVSIPTLAIVITILACNALAGLYGVSIAAVGMLCTLSITLATDAYGPVADNAGGLAEMAGLPADVRSMTDKLDSLGNTTAATGKGLAIGSAILTAVGLVAAFLAQSGLGEAGVDLQDAITLAGVIIGTSLPFIFGALTMLSVDRSARAIISEVRRQFAAAPQLLEEDAVNLRAPQRSIDTSDPGLYPNSSECVRIATTAAIMEMVLPGALAVFIPVGIGFLLGPKGLGGLLAGAIGTCFMLALTMANAGGAWDNAKKWNEKCALDGRPGSDCKPVRNCIDFTFFGIKSKSAFIKHVVAANPGMHAEHVAAILDAEAPTGPSPVVPAGFLAPGAPAPASAAELKQLFEALESKYEAVHAATVAGDTVGDPFKDTSGPALNVLSKTMTMVALMLAPAYRGLGTGDDENFDGFRPYGTIIAAVLLLIIGTICVLAFFGFQRWYARNEEESIKAKVKCQELLRARNASAPRAAAPAIATAAETRAPEASVANPIAAPADSHA